MHHRLVHHRFQAADRVAPRVEVRQTRNGRRAAAASTAAAKPHGHLFATEELLQLIGQRATRGGQVFGARGLLHEVQDGRRGARLPGGPMRRVETHAAIMLGVRDCRDRLAVHSFASEQVE